MYFRFVLFRTELFYSRFFGVISCPRSLLLLLVLLLILLSALYFVGHLLRSLNSLTLTHTGRHKQRGTRRRRRTVAAAAALRRLLQFVVDSLCVWTRLCLCLAHIVLALPLPMPLPVSPFNGCVCFEYI